jgi:hypothetical protein
MRQDTPVVAEEEKMNTNGIHLSSEEDQSEVSDSEGRKGWLDELGIKMDDRLHRIFTAYVFRLSSRFNEFFNRLESVDFVLIIRNIQLYL